MSTYRNYIMLAIISVLIAGCNGLPRTEYYDLACPTTKPVPESERIEAAVTVHPFTAVNSYGQSAIAYRTSPYRLHYDRYRHWASPPAQLAHKTFTTCLRASNLFRKVTDGTLPGRHEYQVYGQVLEFYEFNENGQTSAVLKIELTCTDQDHDILFAITPVAKVQAQKSDDLTGLAQAMSAAMQQVVSNFISRATKRLPRRSENAE